MKKYIASRYNWLGTKHDTREEAEIALKLGNATLDSWTGYCSAFGKFSNINDGKIYEYDDEHIITKEEYEKAMAEKKEAKKQLEIEIKQLRHERLSKYLQIESQYHNQVAYQEHDMLRITSRNNDTRRKKVTEGRVYESVINDAGELQPALARDKDRYVPDNYTIEKIEIIGNKRQIPNEHCTHYDHFNDGKGGQCQHYDKETKKCKLLEECLKQKQ